MSSKLLVEPGDVGEEVQKRCLNSLSASLFPSPRATLHDNPAVTRQKGIYRKATLLVDNKTLLRGRFRSLFTTLVRDYSLTSPASPSASASAFRLARYSGRLRPACSKRSLRGGMDFISPLRKPAVELLPSAPPCPLSQTVTLSILIPLIASTCVLTSSGSFSNRRSE